MKGEEVIDMLPDSHREVVMNVFQRAKEGIPYMGYPYFAVLPIRFDEKTETHHLLLSKLTSLSINSSTLTSGGFRTTLHHTVIPLLDQFKEVFKTDIITIDNAEEAFMNAYSYVDENDVTKWVYLKAEDMVILKISELYSTIKYGNISQMRLLNILNNTIGMASEYRMFKYDDIGRKVIFPDWFDHRSVEPNTSLSFADCPQNEKNTFRLCIGAEVNNGKVSKGKYMISDIHALCPAPDKISMNRLIVQRALTQAMEIIEYNEPIVVSGIRHRIGHFRTLNLISARMEYKGFTHEDGIVISESAARRMRAVSVHLDRVNGSEDDILVQPLVVDKEIIVDNFDLFYKMLRGTNAILSRNKIIARDKFGKATVTSLKVPGIVTGIITINGNLFVESLAVHDMSIGDKIMDMHGNKGTISMIIPDNRMPQLVTDKGKIPIDIIFPPYTVKRADPSREIEEALSMETLKSQVGIARQRDNGRTINSFHGILKAVKKNNLILPKIGIGYKSEYRNTSSTVIVDGKEIRVPVGVVRVARLNHIAREKLSFAASVKYNNQDEQLRVGYTMADNMFHLYSNGCFQTLRDIMKDSNTRRTESILFTMGYEMKPNSIVKIRDNRLTVNPTDYIPQFVKKAGIIVAKDTDYPRRVTPSNIDIETSDTIMDRRWTKSFMAIKLPEWMDTDIVIDGVRYTVKGGEYMVLPPTNVFNLHDGTMTANTIQNLIVRLFRQIDSNVSMDLKKQSCRSLIYAIYNTIARKMFTKNGTIRKMLFPRTSFTGYGVIVPNPDIHIDEVLLPYVMVKNFAKHFNKTQRQMYNIDPTMSYEEMRNNIRGTVLVTRFPGHREHNAIALKAMIWDEYAIGINPSIVAIQDGEQLPSINRGIKREG